MHFKNITNTHEEVKKEKKETVERGVQTDHLKIDLTTMVVVDRFSPIRAKKSKKLPKEYI